MDRGWRRSGSFLYKPDNARTCCPLHTIRYVTVLTQPAHRRVPAVQSTAARGEQPVLGAVPAHQAGQVERKVGVGPCVGCRGAPQYGARAGHGPGALPWRAVRCAARRAYPGAYFCLIQVALRPASSTDEKYALFRKYQAHVHKESESEISSRSGWERFLVDAPFPVRAAPLTQEAPTDAGITYGIFHQEYRCTFFLSHRPRYSHCCWRNRCAPQLR